MWACWVVSEQDLYSGGLGFKPSTLLQWIFSSIVQIATRWLRFVFGKLVCQLGFSIGS